MLSCVFLGDFKRKIPTQSMHTFLRFCSTGNFMNFMCFRMRRRRVELSRYLTTFQIVLWLSQKKRSNRFTELFPILHRCYRTRNTLEIVTGKKTTSILEFGFFFGQLHLLHVSRCDRRRHGHFLQHETEAEKRRQIIYSVLLSDFWNWKERRDNRVKLEQNTPHTSLHQWNWQNFFFLQYLRRKYIYIEWDKGTWRNIN